MKSYYILYSAINNILSGLYRTCKLYWSIVLRNKLDRPLKILTFELPKLRFLDRMPMLKSPPPPPPPVSVFLCQIVEYEKNYIPLTSFKIVYICFNLNQIHAKNTGSKGPKRPQKAPFSRALFGFFICVGPFGALAPPPYSVMITIIDVGSAQMAANIDQYQPIPTKINQSVVVSSSRPSYTHDKCLWGSCYGGVVMTPHQRAGLGPYFLI